MKDGLTSLKVVLIIPVLNEAANVGPLIKGISENLPPAVWTICFVDDGSKDGTVQKINEAMTRGLKGIHLIQRRKTHHGSQRGSALLDGLEWAATHTEADIFIEMDGDLSHAPGELPGGIEAMQTHRADAVIASKYQPGSSVVRRPLGRRWVSRVCSIAVGRVIDPRVRDYSNGYRFYNRRAADVILGQRIRYGSPIYLTEVLAMWLKAGLKVQEIPTTYVGRNEGLSKLRFVDLLKASIAVFEIGWRFHVTGFEMLRKRGSLKETSA